MVAGRPWYHAYPADFFTATQGWDIDLKGPYRLLIDLLNERDRPFPDDPKFVAGILGCSVQRWKKVRAFLLEQGKLIPTEDGEHLTNPRFEREHEERLEKRTAAQMNGHLGGLERARRAGQTDLDFDADSHVHARVTHTARTERTGTSKKNAKKIEKSSEKPSSHSQLLGHETTENPEKSQGSASLRARARDQSPEGDSTQPNRVCDSRGGRLADADLKTLYDTVCEVAGVSFVQPSAIDRAMTQIEKWKDAGVDFDEVAIPAIRSVVLESDEPTRTLGRFNARVMHQHARRLAAEAKGQSYTPPALPVLNPDGEDPSLLPLRTDLLETLGAQQYCIALNRVILEDVGHCRDDSRPIRVRPNGAGGDQSAEALRHGRWAALLRGHAAKYGFTEVW